MCDSGRCYDRLMRKHLAVRPDGAKEGGFGPAAGQLVHLPTLEHIEWLIRVKLGLLAILGG